MFIGVAPCTSLFCHFFVLVKSRKTRDHISAYYFQTRPDPATVYISTLGGARWENWRSDWVIASAEANERLALPSDGLVLDRKLWRTKSSLASEFMAVLDRIKGLATGGLTLMHMVGDFLKRRIAPLQRRARLCCWFTGPNDIGRIQRGPGTDLSWDELVVLVGGITRETFIPESLILPQGIPALCDDPRLRTVILATLLTLNESGMAVRQTSGRDPHREIWISNVPAGGPQPAGVAPSTSAMAPPQVAPGGRRRRDDAGCVALTGRSFRSLPRIASGPQAGPRRRAPRPTARRDALVRHHHHHRSRRHHYHRYHQTRRRHHLGVISPRGTSSSNSSINSKGGDPASRVTRRCRAPSKCSPFFFELNHRVDKS
jgi:hypothetical protein